MLINSFREYCWKENDIRPDSIRERSKISLIRFNNRSLFVLINSVKFSRSSLLSSMSVFIRFENPTIAFNGVRISWLIFAKNADFIWSDSLAFSKATSSSLFCFTKLACANFLYFCSLEYSFHNPVATILIKMNATQMKAISCFLYSS